MSTGSSDALGPLLAALKEMRGAWPSRGWSWDRRVSCVTSSFAIEFETQARAAAARALPTEWTPAVIGRAPQALREIADRTGGLRPGQYILSTTAGSPGFAYALWWPWGDGMTTSARVGLGGAFGGETALQRLRDTFNVEA
jgi:hypothetical protein